MRAICAVVLSLAAAGLAAAGDPPKIRFPVAPATPTPPAPGTPFVLKAGTLYVIASDVEFDVDAGDLLKVIPKAGPRDVTAAFADGVEPLEDRNYPEKNLVFLLGVKPGKTTITVVPVGSRRSDWIKVPLDVQGPTPPPAPPSPPGPGPTPPTPPKPPAPPSPLRAKLKAAYDADPGLPAVKEATRADLVALYKAAGEVANDTTVTTTTQLQQRLRAAGQALAPDQLVGLRTAIAEEIASVLVPGPLTLASRKAAVGTFGDIHDALDW